MGDLSTAVRLLTIVPLGKHDGAHPSRYFALVGWVFAGAAVGIASAAVALGRADEPFATVVAVLIVGAWGLLSGFLHWDGLADCADGLGARGGADRRLDVMRDSSTGAFGVVGVVLVAIAQVVCAAAIVESRSWWALGVAPIVGRWSAGAAMSLWEPARRDGLAARFSSREGAQGLMLGAAPLVPLLVAPAAAIGARVLTFALFVLAALAIPGFFARRFGGITGDVLGASILLTETFVLVVGALVGGGL